MSNTKNSASLVTGSLLIAVIAFSALCLLLAAANVNAQGIVPTTVAYEWQVEAQGGDFAAVNMLSTDSGWAMSLHGEAYKFYAYDGSRWGQSGTVFEGGQMPGRMNDFVMTGQDSGWAVGQYWDTESYMTKGRIWKLQDGTWSTAPISPTSRMYRIKEKGAQSGWAYGSNNIYYYSGSTWSPWNIGSASVLAADGLPDGTRLWVAMKSPISTMSDTLADSKPGMPQYPLVYPLNDIDMVSSSDGWAVGNSGYVLHFNGTGWSQISTPASITDTLTRVDMASPTMGFILGYSSDNQDFVMRYASGTWSKILLDVPHRLTDLSLTSETSGWILGRNGGALEWDGTTWTDRSSAITPPPAGKALVDIAVISPSLAMAATGDALLAYDGQRWKPYRLAERGVKVRAVDMLSSTDGMIVGSIDIPSLGDSNFAAWRFDGHQWVNILNDASYCGANYLTDVSMLTPDYGWTGGIIDCNEGEGSVYQFDGTTWQEHTASASMESWVKQIHLLSETDGWAIWHYYNYNGPPYVFSTYNHLKHFDGTTWNAVNLSLGDCQQIYNLEVLAPNDIWAPASYQTNCSSLTPSPITPVLLHYDGTQWSSLTPPNNSLVFDLEYVSSTDAWAVGANGLILHFDGNSWQQVPSPVGEDLTRVVMLDSTHGRILSSAGTILTWAPAPPKPILDIGKSGNGTGIVASNPSGIACGSQCVSEFTANTAITLAAVADAGSLFGGWNGACTGLGTCVVTLNVSKTVTAVFSQTALPMITVGSQTVVTGPVHFTATLGMSNWDSCTWSFGDGSITNCAAVSAAAGIQSSNLPAVTGSHQYTQSGYYTVSVAATNLAGQFQASIPVTITSANITPPERALHVAMLGNGEGAVKSSPSGIACGASCSADFTADSVVELTAVAQTGSTFTGWSGACTGVRSCNVTMDTERTVTATFDLASQPAIVTNGPTVVTGTVEFTATLGMSNYDRCEWDFGDSSSAACTSNALSAQSSADQPLIVRGSHQYLQSGQYTVTVTAENSAGSFASTTIVAIQPAASTEQSLYLPSVIR